jgi:hypothetical protein
MRERFGKAFALSRANAVNIPGNYFHSMIPIDALEVESSMVKMRLGAILTLCFLTNQTFSSDC